MGIIALMILPVALFSVPIWFLLSLLRNAYWWDYGIIFYATIVWIVFSDYLLIGAQSPSNALMEPLYIQIFSIFIILVRFLFYKFAKISFNKTASIMCILLVIGLAILLRLYMPTIPE